MCTLYFMTTNQEAIRRLFKITRDFAGNMPLFPSIFPNKFAPVVRRFNDDLELAMMRRGMPNLVGSKYNSYSTSIRSYLKYLELVRDLAAKAHLALSLRGQLHAE